MPRPLRLTVALLAWSVAPTLARGDDPPPPAPPAVPAALAKPLALVSPKPTGIMAVALTGRGDVAGFEWVEDPKTPGVIEQVPFFWSSGTMTRLPKLAGYTATFPADASDDGLVVGWVGKPPTPGRRTMLRNQAFVWDAQAGIRGLGTLDGDWASLATGVDRAGRRIAGFAIGDDRVRACVWDRRDDGTWAATILPQADRLGTQRVVISDDGRSIAAVDGPIPCVWTREEDGTWRRETLGPAGSLIPRGVNNDGSVAGITLPPDGSTHAVVWTREFGLRRLAEPAGFARSEALAINNAGIVVGYLDGPAGSDRGPVAIAALANDPALPHRTLDEVGPGLTSATAVNDAGQVAGNVEKEEPTTTPDAKPDPATPPKQR